MKKITLGIMLGILISLAVKQTYAQYEYKRFILVEEDSSIRRFAVIWDDVEKVNCYIYGVDISCVRSKNY